MFSSEKENEWTTKTVAGFSYGFCLTLFNTVELNLGDSETAKGVAVGALTKDERRSAPSALLIDSSVIVGDGVINRVGDAVVFLHLQSAKTRPHCCGDCLRWEEVDASFEAA